MEDAAEGVAEAWLEDLLPGEVELLLQVATDTIQAGIVLAAMWLKMTADPGAVAQTVDPGAAEEAEGAASR